MPVNILNPQAILDSLLHPRCEYTAGHSKTVSIISEKIASDLSLSHEIMSHVVAAGLLHDIGKITWPDYILNGNKKIDSSKDREIVRAHPEIGANFLSSLFSNPLEYSEILWISLVRVHHWKYKKDNNDYPFPSVTHQKLTPSLEACHIKDSQWDLLRGIVQVADCFHAAVASRPYDHQERSTQDALNDMVKRNENGSNIFYHPKVLTYLNANYDWLRDLIGR